MQELHWDSRIDPVGIGVAVQDGVVTLTGFVSNYAEKAAAQDAAHRVPGVLDVASDVEVMISPTHVRTDAEIAHAVRTSLEWNVVLPADRIRTTVSNGIVMVDGQVHSWQQRLAAEDSIRILDRGSWSDQQPPGRGAAVEVTRLSGDDRGGVGASGRSGSPPDSGRSERRWGCRPARHRADLARQAGRARRRRPRTGG